MRRFSTIFDTWSHSTGMDTNCKCHMVFSQRWIRLESTSGSVRWYRVRISRMYTASIMHAAGGVCWQWWSCPDAGQCDHCAVWRHVSGGGGATRAPPREEYTVQRPCGGSTVHCTVYCVLCTALYCGRGDVTALPRIARQCHIATPRSPPCCQPQWPRWSSLLALLVSRLELCHYLNQKA